MRPARLPLAIILSVGCISSVAAQPLTPVRLIATTGAGYVDTIFFGLDPSATPCIDPDLGEYELPPLPPTNVFDMRFIDPRVESSECFGLGTPVDLRPSWTPATIDTFRVRVQPGDNGYPVTFTWHGIRTAFPCRMTLRDPFGGSLFNLNMRVDSTLVLNSPSMEFLIITGSGIPGSAPLGATMAPHRVGTSSAAFAAVIQPHNNPTTAWFEWGWNPSVGSSTTHVSVGEGSLPEFFSQWVGDIYSNPTYYRVVVQNDWGTTMGETRSFTPGSQSSGTQSMIRLAVTSHAAETFVRWAGVHPSGSYCVDGEIGEFFLPPLPPPGTFDVRFTDPRSPEVSCFDVGIGADFRPLAPVAQADTFQFMMQCSPGDFPVTISWNNDLDDYLTPSIRLVDAYGGLAYDVDMRTQQSLVVTNPLIAQFRIISGSTYLNLSPAVLTSPAENVTGSSAQLRGAVNPHGSTSRARFDWGTTSAYGNATGWMDLGAGMTTILVSQTMFSLTPSTTYHFRVVGENVYGTVPGPDRTFTTLPTVDVENPSPMPSAFRLYQNYPNPFNPVTTIRYAVPGTPASSRATLLQVYDILGKVVATLVNRVEGPGEREVVFDASGVPSGVYVYRLRSGSFTASGKMVLAR